MANNQMTICELCWADFPANESAAEANWDCCPKCAADVREEEADDAAT